MEKHAESVSPSKLPGDALQWGLNPLYWTAVKLFIKQIHQLSIDKNIQCEHILCRMHPVSRVHIIGHIVVKVDKFSHIVYGIDDGTGIIHCTDWTRNKDGSIKTARTVQPELGNLVRVFGKLRIPRFRNESLEAIMEKHHGLGVRRELVMEFVELIQDENEELLHWVDIAELWKNVYTKPPKFPKENNVRLKASSVDLVQELSKRIAEDIRVVKTDLFNDQLTDYEKSKLAVHATMFSSSEIKNLPNVKALIQSSNDQIFEAAINHLIKQGFMYNVDKSLYANKDYALVTHVTTLSPMIASILENDTHDSQGMWKSQIIKKMRLDSRCKYIPEKRIVRSLQLLVQQNYLSETVKEKYKLRQ